MAIAKGKTDRRWRLLACAIFALAGCGERVFAVIVPDPSEPIGPADSAPHDAGGLLTAGDCSSALPLDLVGPRPPMGWNGWMQFGCRQELNESKVLAIADAMVSSGMRAAGYRYVNLDHCWQGEQRNSGMLVADALRFPAGIASLADQVHRRGLLTGIHSSPFPCSGPGLPLLPGSAGSETVDGATFAAWGIDYLKYNACSGDSRQASYFDAMRQGLKDAGRPVLLSICAPPFAEWMNSALGQIWRVDNPNVNTWATTLSNLDADRELAAYAQPGGFNDPDALAVGNGVLTDSESRAQFSLWSIMAAPLLASNDLTVMSDATRDILTNTEVIALDQDPLGLQGTIVHDENDVEVFAKPLASCGSRGVVFFNRGESDREIRLPWPEIWLAPGVAAVRDLWLHSNLSDAVDGITTRVPPHDVVALRISGTEPDPVLVGNLYLSDISVDYATNGYGTLRKDRSIGGGPLSIRGQTYAKGLGAHAPSLFRYYLGRACTELNAMVGVDDASGTGSVVFQVWSDGRKLFDSGDSGVVTSSSPPVLVQVDITGRSDLRLFVSTAADGGVGDHADWADARLRCNP